MHKYADVDEYLAHATRWKEEAGRLRKILLGCGLDEEIKWGKPCYSTAGNNVCIMQPMKDFLALMFFKGALVDDPQRVLREQGANSRSARRVCLTSVAEVGKMKTAIQGLVRSGIEVETLGKTLPERAALVLTIELQARLDGDPTLKAAFEKLTPGRQREYNLFVSGAKQSKTRTARVEKHVARILAGKGLRDG